jgi:hypothetical protein
MLRCSSEASACASLLVGFTGKAMGGSEFRGGALGFGMLALSIVCVQLNPERSK